METDSLDLSNLEIKEKDRKRTRNEEGFVAGRTLRKRIRPLDPEKRQIICRPRKIDEANQRSIENYYLDRKVKRSSPALETIFEEPKNEVVMSSRKLRRCLQFSETIDHKSDKNKVKKRAMKTRNFKKNKMKNKLKAVSLEDLMEKLKDLDDDDNLPAQCIKKTC